MAKSSMPTDILLGRLGDTADWRVRDTQTSPSERLMRAIFGEGHLYRSERLMCAIFGEGYRSELRDTPMVKQGLEDEMRLVLDTYALRGPRQRQGCEVLILRFGLRDGRSRTLEEIGQEVGVGRERIRQIEAKTLRELRHPTHTRRLKPFVYPHNDLDVRVLAAREELYEKLSRLYPRKVALQVVKNIKRRHLREAFRSVESALRFSCGNRINHCLNCDKPLPPGWTVCDAHCRRQWKELTLVCDGCGREFRRHQTNIFTRRPDGERRASRRTFCCRSCFLAQDGTGPPCQTCGRPKTTMPRHSAGVGLKTPLQNAPETPREG